MRDVSFFFLLFFCFNLLAAPQAKAVNKKSVASKTAVPRVAVKNTVAQRRGPASDPDAPIEVRGQSRNLNMLLILQNQDEIIDFIKMRKDYQVETRKMNY